MYPRRPLSFPASSAGRATKRRSGLGVLLLLLLLGGGSGAWAEGRTVKVGIYQNDPKVFMDRRGRPAGFFVTLLEAMAKEAGWRLEYHRCHWAQCLQWLEEGRIDLLPDVAWSRARARKYRFGREVALSSWSVFYTPEGERLLSLKALDGKRVAVVKGSIQYQALERHAQGLGIHPRYLEVAAMADAFDAVRQGRADVALVNTWFGWRNAGRYRLRESLVHVEPTLLYIAASPRAEALLPVVDGYLLLWKQDRDSLYHRALETWLLPPDHRRWWPWLVWIALLALLLLVTVVLLVVLVRKLVRSKTAELQAKKDRLDHLAHHDPLTGLPNRLLFFDRLEQGIRQARRHGQSLALLFLDLDQFKQINDTAGHAVGDRLLQAVAQRLREAVRESDTIARIGGDEFAIIMDALADPADVVAGVRHVMEAFREPVVIPGHQFAITLSIGISLFPQDGEDAQTLLRNADTAMFRAKAEGRNTYQLYDREMTRETMERAVMEAALREAVAQEAFSIRFQPQVSLADGRLVGFEVLCRWYHPRLGQVSPDRFIPLAEEVGLMVELGEQVLRKACRQYRRWRQMGLEVGVLAVNLSGRQLRDPKLLERVEQVLACHHCPSSMLELEITEDFVMAQPDAAIDAMRRLRALGIELAIDDFGTGYSSLAYLKTLPVSKLKIDRSFIDGIPEDENDVAIARAVIALGKTLGLKVVAEGVETEAQAGFLRQAGCDEAQGHRYGRPLTAGEAEVLLRQGLEGPWESWEELGGAGGSARVVTD